MLPCLKNMLLYVCIKTAVDLNFSFFFSYPIFAHGFLCIESAPKINIRDETVFYKKKGEKSLKMCKLSAGALENKKS